MSYEYAARVIRVVDADTVWLAVDLGFDTHSNFSIRLFGINAPEVSTDEGKAARDHVSRLLPPGAVVVLKTIKDKKEKYGRYLGIIYHDGPELSLNDHLVAEGMALPYMTGSTAHG